MIIFVLIQLVRKSGFWDVVSNFDNRWRHLRHFPNAWKIDCRRGIYWWYVYLKFNWSKDNDFLRSLYQVLLNAEAEKVANKFIQKHYKNTLSYTLYMSKVFHNKLINFKVSSTNAWWWLNNSITNYSVNYLLNRILLSFGCFQIVVSN